MDISEFEAGGLRDELLASELREVKTRKAVTAARREASKEWVESAHAKATLARLRLEVSTIASDVKGAAGVMDNLISAEISLLVSRIRRATVDSVEGVYEKLFEAVRSDSPENSRSLTDGE